MLLRSFVVFSLSAALFISCSNPAQDAQSSFDYSEKAQDFITKNEFDSALFYLDKTLELNPKNYKSLTWKSTIYVKLKQFDNAIANARQVVALQPHYAESWAYLGMLYDITGDSIQARSCYAQSISEFDERILKETDKKAKDINKLNRAASLVLIGKPEDAKFEYQNLILNSEIDTAYINSISGLTKEEYLNILFQKEENQLLSEPDTK